jgi:hypothetical protein
MKKQSSLFLFGVIIILLSGCNFPQEAIEQTPVDLATAIPYVPTLLPTETVEATKEVIVEEPETIPTPTTYTMTVDFDVETHVLKVIEEINYLNKSEVALNNIAFVVPMNHQSDIFTLTSFAIGEEQIEQQVDLQGIQFNTTLSEPLQPQSNLLISLTYEIQLPEGRGVLGYTDRQINVCDWYVFIPPYQMNSGWMVNEYHDVGEYLVYDIANFDVTLQLQNAPVDLTVVGSVPAIQTGNEWIFIGENMRTFVWTASSQYIQLSQADNPDVMAYVFPEDEEAGWKALSTTISAWNLYNAIYGIAPQQKLFVIEADFYDGMEYEGLYYLGFDYFESYNGGEKNYLTAIAAHETAHQWWFASVGNDAAYEPWLDESLAIYSELIFYETYYPGNENWWWNFRVDSFNPEGTVNSDIYQYRNWRPYINAIYLRGARMIQDLRTTMGDEAFFLFLQEYYRIGSGKIMTRQDFFNLAAHYSDTDLQPIMENYFSE